MSDALSYVGDDDADPDNEADGLADAGGDSDESGEDERVSAAVSDRVAIAAVETLGQLLSDGVAENVAAVAVTVLLLEGHPDNVKRGEFEKDADDVLLKDALGDGVKDADWDESVLADGEGDAEGDSETEGGAVFGALCVAASESEAVAHSVAACDGIDDAERAADVVKVAAGDGDADRDTDAEAEEDTDTDAEESIVEVAVGTGGAEIVGAGALVKLSHAVANGDALAELLREGV